MKQNHCLCYALTTTWIHTKHCRMQTLAFRCQIMHLILEQLKQYKYYLRSLITAR